MDRRGGQVGDDAPETDARTLPVGPARVGMVGLGAIFDALAAAGRAPSSELGRELVALASERNYIPPSVASDYAKALLAEYRRHLGEEVPEEHGALAIKILGPGCPRCEGLTSNVIAALEHLGLAADVEHVREPGRIGEYGVLGTPALVVGGEVVSTGKVLSVREIEGLLGEGVCDG